jgi:CubicO group peptidase (beta-lactamase class C family)
MRMNHWHHHGVVALFALACFGLSCSDSQVARPSAPSSAITTPSTAKPAPASPYTEAISASRAAVLEMMKKDSVPGVGVAVVVDGEMVWSEGFGFADVDRREPVTRETKFGIGSVTKSLTMALVGRLVEEGLVDLDAPVERYLPEFPHKDSKISVRLIAGHLSGFDDSISAAQTYTSTHYATTSEALRLFLKEPLKHRPLERHFYTTGPYTFIAGVVEKATQKDFRTSMSQYVTGPLGLSNTVPNDRKAVIPHRTSFYLREGDKTVAAPYFDPSYKLAGAGYLSTAEDMARFGAAFLKPGFLEPATVDELFRTLRTSAGEDTGFGLGWRAGVDAKKRRIVHQPGGGPGISSWLLLYPDENVVIAILSNQTGAPVGDKALDTIADSFIERRPRQAPVSEQSPDRSFRPPVSDPAFKAGEAPLVCLDEGHNNFHTLADRFWAFGELLRRDGYRVKANRAKFGADALARCKILVIANAQPGEGGWDSYPYPTPSAFADEEIHFIQRWVRDGGALLLIADHMPVAGAAQKLAAAFEVEFNDGFAVDRHESEEERAAALAKPTLFRLDTQTLRPHGIVNGRSPKESVTSVRTFTGQAFRAPAAAQPLLVLPPSFVSLMPERAWQFGPNTRKIPVGGWLQGAVMPFGSGRAAFFGEAAMFSAQVSGPERKPMGMNAPMAEQNFQFVLNLMHWLSGILK